MSSLTGSQINQSYQGLLKLADSTTGITSSVQSIQDGLGNDTGFEIGLNRLQGGNLIPFYKAGVGQYYGNGFGTAPGAPTAGSENKLCSTYFYDNGVETYSAITVNCTTLHASETVDISLYNSQYLDGYGYVPYQKVMSEITITGTTSTGVKTMVLPTPFSFSGTGPGVYFAVARYNAATTPTIRFAFGITSPTNFLPFVTFNTGWVFNTAASAAFLGTQNIGTTAVQTWVYNTASFPSTFTSTEAATLTTSSSALFVPGFLLHTVR
jgi:hypothetical protein